MGTENDKHHAFGYMNICPICGKKFLYNSNWTYKKKAPRGNTYFCSWTCFNKADNPEIKKMLKQQAEARINKENSQQRRKYDYEQMWKDFDGGMTILELVEKYQAPRSSVENIVYCQRPRPNSKK